MEKITLTQETIDAILSFKDDIYAANYGESEKEISEDFHQGECVISVVYATSMEWVEDIEVHDEIPPPNEEDLSHWECYNVDITDVIAFDNDGNDLIITNKQELYGKEN